MFEDVGGEGYGRDRGVELMCDIVYEMIVYVGEVVVREDDIDSKDEGEKEQECEDE